MVLANLLIAGDLLPWNENVALFKAGDAKSLFGTRICKLFETADYSIVNLEGPLTESTLRQSKIGPVLKADRETVKGLKALGVKAVALANNHVTDYLDQGVEDTIKTLTEASIQYVGAGYDAKSIRTHLCVNLKGIRVCLYNVSESFFNIPGNDKAGVNVYDEYLVCKEIQKLKENHDFVVVLYHGGAEYFPYPTPMTRKRFHRMADSGADCIMAQHTHCIGCEEWYNHSYLLYGQGNFLFSMNADDPVKKEGLLVELEISANSFNVVKHKTVLTLDNCIDYSEKQDLDDFYSRSRLMDEEEYILEKYRELKPDSLVNKYLLAYKGNGFFWRILKVLLPKSLWRSFLESYSPKQLQRILFTMTSDRANEDVCYIWRRILERKGAK